jgi:S1-C subfamily serine protease
MRVLVAGTAFLLVASPAMAERQLITPSGQPDSIFPAVTSKDAVSKLANQCMNKGWSITSQTDNQLVCEIPVNGFKAALQQMLIGNSYSTTPRSFVRFTVANLAEHARAQAAAWVETQMAFGQMRQQPYTDDGTMDGLVSFMLEAGGELTPGTRRTGNWFGIDGEVATDGRKYWFAVKHIFPGGPAARAGLRPGDQITKVANRTFKTREDFNKQAAKIAPGVSFPLSISREAQAETLNITSTAWPAVGTPEWDAIKNWKPEAGVNP